MNSHLITQAKVDIINMLLMDLGTSFFEIDEILAGKFLFFVWPVRCPRKFIILFSYSQTNRQTEFALD